MLEELTKFFSILLLTMLKFIAGPVGGYAAGYTFIKTVLVTVFGMMTSVGLFTYFGTFLREKVLSRFIKNRNKFTKRNRKFVKVWSRYGVIGVAVLTPILLTPIGGTLLLTAFRTPKSMIMIYMTISALFWALVISGLVFLLGDQITERFS